MHSRMIVGMTSTSALETSSVACMPYLSGASFSSLEMNSFLTNKLFVSCKIVTFAGMRDDSIPFDAAAAGSDTDLAENCGSTHLRSKNAEIVISTDTQAGMCTASAQAVFV